MAGIQKYTLITLCCFLALSCQWDCGKPANTNLVLSPIPKDTIREAGPPTFLAASENARLVLISHCGSCHQSSLDSHKSGAIAFFDLDMGPDWHVNLKMDNINSLEQRVRSNTSITAQDKEALLHFVELKKKR